MDGQLNSFDYINNMKLCVGKVLLIPIIFFLFGNHSIAQKDKKDIKYQLFVKASENLYDAPNYVVVYIAKNGTNKVEEFCTTMNFLRGAIHIEYNLQYTDSGIIKVDSIIKSNLTRTFKFTDTLSLNNILYGLYTKKDLRKYRQKLNVHKIKNEYRKGELKSKTFDYDENGVKPDILEIRKRKTMFAHIMFNNGIIMSDDSRAGSMLYFNNTTYP